MRISISAQAAVFLQMALLGVLEGILYTFFRCLHKKSKNRMLAGALDLFFWISALVLFLLGLYQIHSGAIRVYVLIGAVLGILLYFLSLYRVVCTILDGVLDVIFKIFQFFFKILLTPGQLLYKLLIVPFCGFLKTKRKTSDNESREKEE